MKLSTIKKVKKIAIQSGWEEMFLLSHLLDNKGFVLLKTSGTGQITLNVSESWVDIETNDYFKEKLKEEKEKKELGYYTFLYQEAKDLMKLFENTFEHKRALIFENILELLKKGFKIIVLNKKRRVEIKGDKKQYIKNKIEKTLKSKEKKAVFQIVY